MSEIQIEKLLSQANDINNEIIEREMKISNVALKRYTATKGKSLKWYEWVMNQNTRESASGTTVNIVKDGYKHKPFVGDVLGGAPDEIGGAMTAVTITLKPIMQ